MTKGRQSGESQARGSVILRGNLGPTLSTRVIWQQTADLRPFPNNARYHPEKQIKTLARSISRLGWARPIVIDDTGTILCGHGCFAAAKHLSLQTVPTLAIKGMTHAEKLALVIADNKVAEGSWFEND